MSHAATHDAHHEHHPTGITRWIFTTNHKDIRAELFEPGLQFVDPQFFNSMTTLHALVMIFGAVMPAFVGLANWMIPMMIGAPDMALPRMNNWSFWLLPFAFTLLLSTLFMPGGAPAGGWTMYAPLVLQTGDAFPFLIFAVHIMGISSIMGAINIIATVFNMRAPGMTFMKLPLFVWTWIITAFLLIAAMPVLAGAVTMLLTDKFFGRRSGSSPPSCRPSPASRCSVIAQWCTPPPQSPSCRSSSGPITCSLSVCRLPANCSSCTRRC